MGIANRFVDCAVSFNGIKQRLIDNFIQGWNEQLENSSRTDTYKLITNFKFQTIFRLHYSSKVQTCIHLSTHVFSPFENRSRTLA